MERKGTEISSEREVFSGPGMKRTIPTELSAFLGQGCHNKAPEGVAYTTEMYYLTDLEAGNPNQSHQGWFILRLFHISRVAPGAIFGSPRLVDTPP